MPLENKNDNKNVIISTKVTPACAEKININAAELGFNSPYELLQIILDCWLRYTDKPTKATEDTKRLMQIFDELTYTTGRLRMTNAPLSGKSYIKKAIYFVHHPQRTFDYLVMVDRLFMDDANEDYNVQTMFKEFISCAFPKQWRKLQNIARAIGSESELEAFLYLLDADDTPNMTSDEATYTELFGDAQRDITGAHLNIYDKKYLQHKHHNIDPISNGRTGAPRTARDNTPDADATGTRATAVQLELFEQ